MRDQQESHRLKAGGRMREYPEWGRTSDLKEKEDVDTAQ